MWLAPHFGDTWHGDAVTYSCVDTWHVTWWVWRWTGMQTLGTSYTGCRGRWQGPGRTPGQGRSVTARSSSTMTGRSATRHTTRCWRPPPHSVLQHPCSAAVSCMIEVDLNWCPVQWIQTEQDINRLLPLISILNAFMPFQSWNFITVWRC